MLLRRVLFFLLFIGLWMTVDLGYNFFYSLIPEVNDGITICGFWAQLLLPDHGWSRLGYLKIFRNAAVMTTLIGGALIASYIFLPAQPDDK